MNSISYAAMRSASRRAPTMGRRDSIRRLSSASSFSDESSALVRRDAKHVVHPYTVMSNPLESVPIASASKATLILEDGRRLVDGMSSWWAAVHGYAHPVLDQAVTTQIAKMSHVMFVRSSFLRFLHVQSISRLLDSSGWINSSSGD